MSHASGQEGSRNGGGKLVGLSGGLQQGELRKEPKTPVKTLDPVSSQRSILLQLGNLAVGDPCRGDGRRCTWSVANLDCSMRMRAKERRK